jgi:hypothetical protein
MVGHVAQMRDNENFYRSLVGKAEGKTTREILSYVDINILKCLRNDSVVWTGSNTAMNFQVS